MAVMIGQVNHNHYVDAIKKLSVSLSKDDVG